MKTIQTDQIVNAIREMCMEANYYLSEDMKHVLYEAADREESPLGRQILGQLKENLDIAGQNQIPTVRIPVWPWYLSPWDRRYISRAVP